MAIQTTQAKFLYDEQLQGYRCTGSWSISTINDLFATFINNSLPHEKQVIIDGELTTYLDSAGALCLHDCIQHLAQHHKEVKLTNFTNQQLKLLQLIDDNKHNLKLSISPPSPPSIVYRIGKESVAKIKQAKGFIILLGDLSTKIINAFGHWQRFQLPSIISVIHSSGIQALPIVGLLSFLIGVVLAYQMGIQLQTYGANIFIAYLSGLAIFREFAPLITAIIVAGRTSSSFTAQIGSMKVNEEIDAIATMGLSSTQLLVLPKVLGLLFVFPLLIFWADLFSILGAMFMSKWMLDVSHYDFLQRIKNTVGLDQLMLGLYKAPVFALIISMVGCFQGLRVESNALSIGFQTTKSVVQALFLIIIADACFSVIYSWLDL